MFLASTGFQKAVGAMKIDLCFFLYILAFLYMLHTLTHMHSLSAEKTLILVRLISTNNIILDENTQQTCVQ